MDLDRAAGLWKALGIQLTFGRQWAVDIEQRQRMVWRVRDPLQRGVPGRFVHYHGHYLGRKERPVLDGQQVQLVGQALVGYDQISALLV